ncbi:MAG: amidohydrolase family protein [Adhaeribacter sp.]
MINRRKFIANSALSAAGLLAGSKLAGCAANTSAPAGQNQSAIPQTKTSSFHIMEEVMKYRKIDAHAHIWDADHGAPEMQIELADRLNMEKLFISAPVTRGPAPQEEIRKANDTVLKAVKMFPDRFVGQMTLNVRHQKESLEEIKRCIGEGMVGLKLYTQVKLNDPLFYPIVEKFIDLKMVILMHVGIGKARVKFNPREPENVSIPEYFVDMAKRYPEAMFQLAHIGGGIDWEDACKALQHSPNVYVDTSGSNNEASMVDFAIKYLGEDRLLFGCDNSFYQAIGHVLASNLTEKQKHKLFFENYNNILRKSGHHVH